MYLGRLSDAAGKSATAQGQDSDAAAEHAAALKYYQSALAVAGGSEKAREAAQQGVQGVFKR